MSIKVIGIGGIGCCLLPVLGRYLANLGEPTRLLLIDGDQYESHNRDRQTFHRLGNKAEVAAESLADKFPSIEIVASPIFVTESNVVSLVGEGDVVFSCVDNHITRLILSERMEDLSDALLISGGNELTDGNVQIHLRKGGEDVTLPIANQFHPEIEVPEDKHPDEMSCEERAVREPQVLFANNAIAAVMCNVFYVFRSTGVVPYDEVYIDILTGNSRSVYRNPLPKGAVSTKEGALCPK